MSRLSILVPSRNERYLTQTVNDIFAKARGDIEVIVILDGKTNFDLPESRPWLYFWHNAWIVGKSESINLGASVATGKYLMFIDAHCSVCEGFDEILKAECDADWVVIPRYLVLESKTFTLKNHRAVDYYYMAVSWEDPEPLIQCGHWMRRTLERLDGPRVDESMSIPGSCTFMTAEHFHKRLGGLASPAVGTDSTSDWLDVVMKTWACGGKVMVNKNAWYGHMNAPPSRGYTVDQDNIKRDYIQASRYWLNYRGERDFGWLVDRFWPLPNVANKMRDEKFVWPDDWRKYYEGSSIG
jgi:glycosyltransferase involved in cell wall biosynthesis